MTRTEVNAPPPPPRQRNKSAREQQINHNPGSRPVAAVASGADAAAAVAAASQRLRPLAASNPRRGRRLCPSPHRSVPQTTSPLERIADGDFLNLVFRRDNNVVTVP